mmetsp:Transcript_86502/g.253188  ORF Transcript_86502/g.253188 Transcript_86502/m.253188 type:complete len:383 (+) Transcript_86502:99-1247(+)
MLDSWDRWEDSQATDPRRALLCGADHDAKRRRLGESPLSADVWGGCLSTGPVVVPGPPVGVAAPVLLQSHPSETLQSHMSGAASEDDITARIMNALQHHIPDDVRSSGVSQGPSPPPAMHTGEPELSAQLLETLRTLLPTGEPAEVCRSSEVGQELFRVVQSLAPQPPGPAPRRDASPSVAQLASAEEDQFRVPPPPSLPREEDAESSDDGVPHRLPPGFGAIPEDLVEERARQREEERVLRLKATQPCRFGRRCKRRDCPNAHTEGRDIDTTLNPCAFGRRCKRKGCFYDHPEGRVIDDDPTKGMCKYGARCSRPDCLYDHPEGRTPLSGPDPRICYFCHDPGHIASDCPRNPESWNYSRQVERGSVVVQAQEQKAIAAPI